MIKLITEKNSISNKTRYRVIDEVLCTKEIFDSISLAMQYINKKIEERSWKQTNLETF